jgi:hypothetical protein
VRGAAGALLLLAGCYGHDVVATRAAGTCGGADDPQPLLPYAVCTCAELTASDRLQTDAFDRCAGPARVPGGGLGVNGRLDLNGPSTVAGDLVVGGAAGLVAGAGGALTVGGDAAVGGPLLSDTDVGVEGDALVQGDLRARDLTVGGTLTLPEGAGLQVSRVQSVGAVTRGPVTVAPPCPCDAPLDVAQVVASHAEEHDDAALGLHPGSLRDASGVVNLGCGSYYFEEVKGQGSLILSSTGRASVYIAGDLVLQDLLQVNLSPGASLDLWIAGALVTPLPPALGGAEEAGRVRLYLGGGGTLQLTGGGRFGGRVYAPRAEVVSSGPVEIYGGLFARRVAASGALVVHHDLGAGCP